MNALNLFSQRHQTRAYGNLALTAFALTALTPPTVLAQEVTPPLTTLQANAPGTETKQYALGEVVPPQERGEPGIKILPAVPLLLQGTKMGADITGPFADVRTGIVEDAKVAANAASDKCVQPGATYHLELIIQLERPVYGFTLGRAGQKVPAFAINLSTPAKTIHVSTDIEGATLAAGGARWDVQNAPLPFRVDDAAQKVSVQGHVSFRGAVSGKFDSFKGDEGEGMDSLTLDALALGQYKFRENNYILSSLFTDLRPTPTLHGVAFGNGPTESLMRVDVDAPQKMLAVRALMDGRKFFTTGLGFGTSDTSIVVGEGAETKRDTNP